MLKIAVVGNDYSTVKRFVEYKFKDEVDKVKLSESIYTLKNGDEIHLCYDEQGRDKYKSMVYDAIIVHPLYESLLDVIIYRTTKQF